MCKAILFMAVLFQAAVRRSPAICSCIFAAVALLALCVSDAVRAQPAGDNARPQSAPFSAMSYDGMSSAAVLPAPAGTGLRRLDELDPLPGLAPGGGGFGVHSTAPSYELRLLLEPAGVLQASLRLRGAVDGHWPADPGQPGQQPLDQPRAQAAPAPARLAMPRADIFGSVAFKASRLAIAPVWQAIVARHSDRLFTQGCATGETICGAPSWRGWVRLFQDAKDLRGAQRMQWVNERANLLIRHVADQTLYGEADHWANLRETVAAGAGDCEDFAIAKMWLLAATGIPLSDMQLVVLRDTARGVDHAVLAVHEGGETYILDSAVDGVRRAETIHHYRPVYTVSAAGSWIHGFRSAQN